MIYRIGLDIGSTTVKMVVADGDGRIVWSRYERHNARVKRSCFDSLLMLRKRLAAVM